MDRIRLAAGSAFLSVSLSGYYLLARTGFSGLPSGSTLGVLSVSFFFLFAPIATGRIRARLAVRKRITGFRSQAGYSLMALALVIFCAFFAQSAGSLFLLAIEALALLSVVLLLLRPASVRGTLRELVPLAVLIPFSVWLASSIWGYSFANPLCAEKFVTGNVNIDTLFHMAIGNMIGSYGVPSTGLDALVGIPYHYGSHFLFAGLARLLRLSVLDVYSFAVPVIFYPLLVNALGSFVIDLRGTCITGGAPVGARFWLVLALFHVGVIPTITQVEMGCGINLSVKFESYLVGSLLFFLFASLVLDLWVNRPLSGERGAPGRALLLCFTLPAMVAILGISKVSFMYLFFAVAAYLAMRLGLLRHPTIAGSLIVSSVVFVFVYHLTNSWGPTRISPLSFLRSWVPRPWLPFFFFSFFFLPWMHAWFRFTRLGLRTLGDMFSALRSKVLLDVEVVFVLAVVGIVPGLVFGIATGGALYFVDFSRWFALACFLGIVEPQIPALFPLSEIGQAGWRRFRLRPICVGGLVAAFLTMAVVNVTSKGRQFLVSNLEIREAVVRCTDPAYDLIAAGRSALSSGRFDEIRSFTHRVFSNEIRRDLANCRDYRSVRALLEIGRLSATAKRESILFVPQSVRAYWNLNRGEAATDFLWAKSTPFIAPAVAGVAVLGGVPSIIPYRVEKDVWNSNALDVSRKSAIENVTKSEASGDRLFNPDATPENLRHAVQMLSGQYSKVFQWYGFEDYARPEFPKYPDAESLGKARDDARALGFRKLIVLEEREGELASRTVDLFP